MLRYYEAQPPPVGEGGGYGQPVACNGAIDLSSGPDIAAGQQGSGGGGGDGGGCDGQEHAAAMVRLPGAWGGGVSWAGGYGAGGGGGQDASGRPMPLPESVAELSDRRLELLTAGRTHQLRCESTHERLAWHRRLTHAAARAGGLVPAEPPPTPEQLLEEEEELRELRALWTEAAIGEWEGGGGGLNGSNDPRTRWVEEEQRTAEYTEGGGGGGGSSGGGGGGGVWLAPPLPGGGGGGGLSVAPSSTLANPAALRRSGSFGDL
eukprot:SAG22_NODE_1414_length_4475_cov_10.897395_4_plen_263_part_00